jgi:hypothetical protein
MAAINSSRHAFRRYLNRRIAARTAPPVPAIGGFPYNRRSVAECDPSRIKTDRHERPEEYGYDGEVV